MPAKYSHVKKRSASGLLKKGGQTAPHAVKDAPNTNHQHSYHQHHKFYPLMDRSISQAMNAVAHLEPAISQLERAIARILLLRYEHDIARLFSTRIYSLSLVQLPTFVMRCLSLGGPSWLVWNHNSEEIKDFFRAVISMDLRQAGDRVATKSVLWSYTALRQFAMSNNIQICSKRGLHSLRLLPYYPALKAHLDVLEAMPLPTLTKLPHLGALQEGQDALEDACEIKYGRINDMPAHPEWDDSSNWREKVRYSYEKTSQILWRVAREFDVRGYGLVLREKLTAKWCECGCSTDHLGEVCERTVREDEEESGVRLGKQREWDGRGSGVYGWETEEEEDIWEIDLDFGGMEPGKEQDQGAVKLKESDTTIGQMMEWRYLRAEKEKERGNAAYRKGDFQVAVGHYEAAHEIEPELPHYQLNLAAAHLKLNNWIEAEKACTNALTQHKSSKGYYRRARARRMLGKPSEAIKDLRAVLKLQPQNNEALNELMSLIPPTPAATPSKTTTPPTSTIITTPSSSSSKAAPDYPGDGTKTNVPEDDLFERLGIPKPKKTKDPPFSRVRGDSRRLKVVLLPSSNSAFPPPLSPENMLTTAGFECEHGVGCSHWKERAREMAQEKEGKGRDMKGKVKTEVAKQIESMKAEGLSYPSWDRYWVKLV